MWFAIPIPIPIPIPMPMEKNTPVANRLQNGRWEIGNWLATGTGWDMRQK